MSLILYKTSKNKSQIEDEYYSELMKGCSCRESNQKILDNLLYKYESLGFTKQELLNNIIQKQSLNNFYKISDGSLITGYST